MGMCPQIIVGYFSRRLFSARAFGRSIGGTRPAERRGDNPGGARKDGTSGALPARRDSTMANGNPDAGRRRVADKDNAGGRRHRHAL
jgi:hypothetical protein